LLNSLIARFVFSQVVIAVVALIVVGAALTAGARPIQRELIYRRLADNLVAAMLFARNARQVDQLPAKPQQQRDTSGQTPAARNAVSTPSSAQPVSPSNRRLRPPANLNPQTLPPTTLSQIFKERLFAIVTEQAKAQHLRAVLFARNSDEAILDTGDEPVDWRQANWHSVPRLAREQRRVLDEPVTQGVVTINGKRWLFAGTQLAAPRSDGEFRFVLMAPEPSTADAFRELIATVPLPAILFVLFLLLAVIFILSLWVAKSMTGGLQTLVAGTEELAAGNLDYRVPVGQNTPREVAALAHSFNQMADQVQQSRQTQRDFVANVSHDLRTPLTSIHGFAQALLDGTANDPETRQRAIQIIHDEAGRLKGLVNELLELARIDSGRLQLKFQPLDLRQQLEWLLDSYQPRCSEAQVQLVRQFDVSSCRVNGDAERLTRVFANLLDNALKYTPQGGTITVSLAVVEEKNHSWAEVAVTDTGPGIPREDTGKVFQRFYQVDKSRTRKQGSGLGLAIVNELVAAHGGHVGVDSVEGLGSRFWVRLPMQPPDQEPIVTE
jgi:signal transduction histidine kinase